MGGKNTPASKPLLDLKYVLTSDYLHFRGEAEVYYWAGYDVGSLSSA